MIPKKYEIKDVVKYCMDALAEEGTEIQDGVMAILEFLDSTAYYVVEPEIMDELAQTAMYHADVYLDDLESGEYDFEEYNWVDASTYTFFGMRKLTEKEWCDRNNRECESSVLDILPDRLSPDEMDELRKYLK